MYEGINEQFVADLCEPVLTELEATQSALVAERVRLNRAIDLLRRFFWRARTSCVKCTPYFSDLDDRISEFLLEE